MAVVALSSFWIFEIRRGAGPSLIHLLSVSTLISLALAVWFIRRGNVRAHRGFMVGTFVGLAAAGLGTLAPGRALYRFFFAYGLRPVRNSIASGVPTSANASRK